MYRLAFIPFSISLSSNFLFSISSFSDTFNDFMQVPNYSTCNFKHLYYYFLFHGRFLGGLLGCQKFLGFLECLGKRRNIGNDGVRFAHLSEYT